MKQIARLATLLAAVLLTTSCTKCWWPEDTVRDITYTVTDGPQASSRQNTDNMTVTVHLTTDAEFDALLEQFCDYAEDGSEVTFYNASLVQHSKFKVHNSTKEAVTYSTTDREAMKRWMAQMEDEGKTVTVTYDPATGTWTGVAYLNADSQSTIPDLIPIDQWLPGTMWVVQREYGSFNESWNWLHFIQNYNATFGITPQEDCIDTLAFDNQYWHIFGAHNYSGEYCVVDSVVRFGPDSYGGLYQISADSMIYFGWHDCSFTQEIQSWLFSRIQ